MKGTEIDREGIDPNNHWPLAGGLMPLGARDIHGWYCFAKQHQKNSIALVRQIVRIKAELKVLA